MVSIMSTRGGLLLLLLGHAIPRRNRLEVEVMPLLLKRSFHSPQLEVEAC